MNDMQNSNLESFRDVLDMQKKQKRGSALITVITVLLFLAAAVFYIKTSHPNFAKKAIAYFKDFTEGQKSLETVSDAIYDEVTPENQSGESGESCPLRGAAGCAHSASSGCRARGDCRNPFRHRSSR